MTKSKIGMTIDNIYNICRYYLLGFRLVLNSSVSLIIQTYYKHFNALLFRFSNLFLYFLRFWILRSHNVYLKDIPVFSTACRADLASNTLEFTLRGRLGFELGLLLQFGTPTIEPPHSFMTVRSIFRTGVDKYWSKYLTRNSYFVGGNDAAKQTLFSLFDFPPKGRSCLEYLNLAQESL
jgi:hypothetical protein